jgi:hypothetical protein
MHEISRSKATQPRIDKDWVIAICDGDRFLGKVTHKMDGGWLVLNPAYDYIKMLSPTPSGGVSKTFMIMALDQFLDPLPIEVHPSGIISFEHASPEDLKEVQTLLDQTVSQIERASLQRRSGLVT